MADQGGKPLQGAIIFAIVALALLVIAYAMWPPDFFGTPISEMSPSMLLRAAASVVLTIIGIEFVGALAIVIRSDH